MYNFNIDSLNFFQVDQLLANKLIHILVNLFQMIFLHNDMAAERNFKEAGDINFISARVAN